jgi:RimJ/RimL family protein N-acetyltransferase
MTLETPRLLLRAWREPDREAFAAMNADPVVMRFFAAPLSRTESDQAIDRYNRQLARDGFTMFAAELRGTGALTGRLAGIIGIQTVPFVIPNVPQPAVEIGWRLTRAAAGQGLATEGARALVDFAFHELGLPRLIAITLPINRPSRRVMEKLGMTHHPELSFDHPRIPAGHPYQRHILYQLQNSIQNE